MIPEKIRDRESGLTSRELLFLAVILGIAGSLILFALGGKRAEGRNAEREADIHRVATAMELYYNGHVRYAQSSAMPESIPGFLNSVPRDPRGEYGWVDNSVTGGNTSQDYCIFARIERASESGEPVYVVAGPGGVRERGLPTSGSFSLGDCE
ncbi:MAG: type II secretion system protein [bacterium]|nr:type II secretion system protein [bacterium]MDZ4231998.1 type II secretion system protein [Candidatus Pacearchaeota archaeon]